MSSYGSTQSGYLHPSQYPPNPQTQGQQQSQPQPPYPTTPGPPPTSQPQAFYPPTPQHQLMYSNSPGQHQPYSTSPYQQPQYPFYSSSPSSANPMPQAIPTHHRRSSSLSQHARPQFMGSAPIAIAQGRRASQAPGYARSQGSHHSQHVHDAHAFGDGEDMHDHGQGYGVLDEETLRQYEKRYAKDRRLEKRPTLGGSVMSMFRALGGKRE